MKLKVIMCIDIEVEDDKKMKVKNAGINILDEELDEMVLEEDFIITEEVMNEIIRKIEV